MAYSAASNVADYCPGLVEDGVFTATTRPNQAAVERFLSAGCAVIEGRLKAAGYSTPVGATAAVYDQIVDLETLYAAARAESVRMTARTTAGERGRSALFMEEFNRGLDDLLKRDLSLVGLSHTSRLYMAGTSVADKEAVEDDSDRVAPRFKRDQFRHEGTQRPGAVGSDGETS
jgi:hypothetical protein